MVWLTPWFHWPGQIWFSWECCLFWSALWCGHRGRIKLLQDSLCLSKQPAGKVGEIDPENPNSEQALQCQFLKKTEKNCMAKLSCSFATTDLLTQDCGFCRKKWREKIHLQLGMELKPTQVKTEKNKVFWEEKLAELCHLHQAVQNAFWCLGPGPNFPSRSI